MLNSDVVFSFYKWCHFTVTRASVSHAPGSNTHECLQETCTIVVVLI